MGNVNIAPLPDMGDWQPEPNPYTEGHEEIGRQMSGLVTSLYRTSALVPPGEARHLAITYAEMVLSQVLSDDRVARIVSWAYLNSVSWIIAQGAKPVQWTVNSVPCSCPHDHDWDHIAANSVGDLVLDGKLPEAMAVLEQVITNPPEGMSMCAALAQIIAPNIVYNAFALTYANMLRYQEAHAQHVADVAETVTTEQALDDQPAEPAR